MKCETCQQHLSAYLDQELDSELQADVECHLEQCEACQQHQDDLRRVDERMARLRLPVDGAETIVAAIRDRRRTSQTLSTRRTATRWFAGAILAAVAACLAVAIFTAPTPPAKTSQSVAGRLVRSTGAIDVLLPGHTQWQTIDKGDEVLMYNGARIRTSPDVICEIETNDSSKLRMDTTAELILHAPQRVEVVQGQVWCRVSESKTLQVDANPSNSPASQMLHMTCPSNSEYQWVVDSNGSACQSLSENATQWANSLSQFRCPVGPGESVSIDKALNVQRSEQDSAATKLWQLPLLAIAPTSDHELRRILEPVLVHIGSTKTGYLREQQIRQLGPPGAIPLLAYVQSEGSRTQTMARHTAMRIAAEIADDSARDRLRQLAGDEDQVISKLAAHALSQLE